MLICNVKLMSTFSAILLEPPRSFVNNNININVSGLQGTAGIPFFFPATSAPCVIVWNSIWGCQLKSFTETLNRPSEGVRGAPRRETGPRSPV